MGEVETVAFSEDNAVSITVYKGHRQGSASSTDTSPAALDAMVMAALDIADVSAEDPCFGLADRDLMRMDYADLDLCHPWSITPPDAIALALSCEKQALAMDKRISNSDGVNISTYTFCHGYANTHGFTGVVHSSRHSMSCSLIAKEGEGLFSSFIGAISGSNLYRKNSFLLDSIGQQIFPASIRIYDQPHLLGALGSASFDGEGVPTRNNVWVDQGKICQYVLNSYSSRKLGLKTTANSGGVFNLTIDPTAGDLNTLLKKWIGGCW